MQSQMPDSEPLCLDYFSGGVPPLIALTGTLDDLDRTIDRKSNGTGRINELCLVGLVSYVEAFFKDQFAAILNIEPTLLNGLIKAGHDVLIDPLTLLAHKDAWSSKIGFLLAEKYDFGTWKKVNSLFSATIGISPFSKDEGRRFDALLRDRNLLVHHGGVFTTRYLEQKKMIARHEDIPQAFWGSLVISASYLDEQLAFARELANKAADQACKRLKQAVEASGPIGEERSRAIDAFVWTMD